MLGKRQMSDIYTMPGHLIRRMHQLSSSVFATNLREMGVDLTAPQFAALALLHDHPGIDQATLAGLIAHDRATIGGVVSRLIAKGLVEREVSGQDRRARVLKLSPDGEELLGILWPVVERFQSAILPGLNDDERREFIRLAHKATQEGNHLTRAPFVPITQSTE